MRKEIIKIFIVFLVVIGLVFFGLNYIFFNKSGPTTKATGETMYLSFNNKDPVSMVLNGEFTVTLLAKPSINTILRGYHSKIVFDKTKLKLMSINYNTGTVSEGLGDTNADVDTINSRGSIYVVAEDQTASGLVMGTANGVELVTVTFKVLDIAGTVVQMEDTEFYTLNSDLSLFNGWIIAAQNLNVNQLGDLIPTCHNLSDDFSGDNLNENNWRLVSWANSYGYVGIGNGILSVNLPASTEVTAKSTFIESKKILMGDFSSEITMVSRNDPSTYEFFQFNNLQYSGGGGSNGFGFRILNGSVYTEIYGSDNPNNPGASNHNIAVSNTSPFKLKLEKVRTTAKMSVDMMGGQGYQVIRVFENFNTNSGYIIAGVQHTGPANLFLSASFDNYNQTCAPATPSPTPTPNTLCLCNSNNNACTMSNCSFSQYENVTYRNPIRCKPLEVDKYRNDTLPTAIQADDWCRRPQRTKGDADGNDIVNLLDYYYTMTVINTTDKIPQHINPDFNGDGLVDTSDRQIVIRNINN